MFDGLGVFSVVSLILAETCVGERRRLVVLVPVVSVHRAIRNITIKYIITNMNKNDLKTIKHRPNAGDHYTHWVQH